MTGSVQHDAQGTSRSIYDAVLTRSTPTGDDWYLVGSRCAACGETSVGAAEWCGQCGGSELTTQPLPRAGSLWSYTVVRHRPPGNCRLPEAFDGLALGLVELAGARVLTPLDVPFDRLAIGMPVVLVPHVLYQDDDGTDVVAFRFAPGEDAA
jgi:uncharacterized OB-fold protein